MILKTVKTLVFEDLKGKDTKIFVRVKSRRRIHKKNTELIGSNKNSERRKKINKEKKLREYIKF